MIPNEMITKKVWKNMKMDLFVIFKQLQKSNRIGINPIAVYKYAKFIVKFLGIFPIFLKPIPRPLNRMSLNPVSLCTKIQSFISF